MEKEIKQNDAALAALMAPEQEPAQEVFPGMTVEEIRAVYFNADALTEPPYRVFQLNSDGYRYYYRFNADGTPEFYPSVTTLLKQVMPTPPALLDWMVANGKEGSKEKRDLAAAYGTFMHAQFETLIINRRYNFDNVPAVLLAYMEQNNLPEKFYGDSLTKIRKDVCAFAQFVKDYNVRPLAVEIALVHPDYHYAGMVDLPCVMTDPKTGETFPAIVDFKSGRKGFYEEHEIQLHLYKDMWNVNFPALPISRVFNFSPKDWRGVKPTYNLKEQTDSPNAAKIPALLALAAIEDNKMDNTFTIIAGEINLDGYNPKTCITSLSLADLIKTKATKDNAPETAGFVPEQAERVPNNGVSVPKQAENVLMDANDVPDWLATDAEKAEKAEKQAKRGRKALKPINPTPEPEKPVKTDFSQKLLNDEIEL